VGFATTRPTGGALELIDLFTDPDWMRKGIATRLMDDVVEYAALTGVAGVTVVGNPHALAFYRQYGFSEIGAVATEFGEGHRLHLAVAV
jgi:GNAT superfamily N-acetyltransferase